MTDRPADSSDCMRLLGLLKQREATKLRNRLFLDVFFFIVNNNNNNNNYYYYYYNYDNYNN